MILIFIDHGSLQAQNILPMYKTFSPVNMFLQSSLLADFLKNCLRVYKGNNQPLSGFLLKLSFLVFRGVCLPIIDCSLIPTLALCMRQKPDGYLPSYLSSFENLSVTEGLQNQIDKTHIIFPSKYPKMELNLTMLLIQTRNYGPPGRRYSLRLTP